MEGMGLETEVEDAGTLEGVTELSVARDGVLPRYSADTVMPVYLGRDFELALLSYTVRLEAEVSGSGDGKSMRVSGELLEVARVRIAPVGARQMAMAVLQQLLESGHLAGDALKDEISSMIASAHPETTDSGQ